MPSGTTSSSRLLSLVDRADRQFRPPTTVPSWSTKPSVLARTPEWPSCQPTPPTMPPSVSGRASVLLELPSSTISYVCRVSTGLPRLSTSKATLATKRRASSDSHRHQPTRRKDCEHTCQLSTIADDEVLTNHPAGLGEVCHTRPPMASRQARSSNNGSTARALPWSLPRPY